MTDQSVRVLRRVDLDWIRIAAFGLLILYHVGMVFVPWYYHVKSTHVVPALQPFMLAPNPWRLSLLFVVAGAATRLWLQIPLRARWPPADHGDCCRPCCSACW